MHDELILYLEEAEMILIDVDRYKTFKKQLLSDLKSLNKEYDSANVNFKTYTKLKQKLLDGKTKEEQIEYFNAYILSLVKKLEYINTQVFSLIYNYTPEKSIIISQKTTSVSSNLNESESVVKPESMTNITKENIKIVKDASSEKNSSEKQMTSKINNNNINNNLQRTTVSDFVKDVEKIVQSIPINEEDTKTSKTSMPVNLESTNKEITDLKIPLNIKSSENIQTNEISVSSTLKEVEPVVKHEKLIHPIYKEKLKVVKKIHNEIIETKKQKVSEISIPVNVETKNEEVNDLEILPKTKSPEKAQTNDINSTFPKELVDENVQNIDYEYGVTPKPLPRKHHVIPKPRKKSFKSIAKHMFIGEAKKEDLLSSNDEKGVGFKSILNIGFLKDLIYRMRDNQDMISKNTLKKKSLLDFKSSDVDFESEAKTNPNLLIKQASQLKELLKIRKIDIYKPSMIGTIANIFVRRFSIFIIDNFPDFFKHFYLTLRYANIKVLSNTYVNIMVFLSILSAFLFGSITATIAIASGNPIFLVISKTFLLATLGVIICASAMIYYPHMKIESRIKSINTNLPFAIDHMSSISASGVPPSTMFRLLSESKEYGDVSLEIEKASNFIDIFGYDLLTAIKSVSATTPSPQFKEFFEGLISTIETGGSLKNYLAQKSQESMLAYKIERQKYTETIATYSDIYTGVLIAAPLFFVSALSLVSILGGKIGGFAVETVISFGTYILIPLLNVAFIMFLEFNQPEV